MVVPFCCFLQLRAELLIDCLHECVTVPALRYHGYDGVLVREDDGQLTEFAVRPEGVVFSTPEQVAVRARSLLLRTFLNPVGRKKLPSVQKDRYIFFANRVQKRT